MVLIRDIIYNNNPQIMCRYSPVCDKFNGGMGLTTMTATEMIQNSDSKQ